MSSRIALLERRTSAYKDLKTASRRGFPEDRPREPDRPAGRAGEAQKA
jgi:hypothetical protein